MSGTVVRPANLHLSVAAPSLGATALQRRVEQKFFIVPQRGSLAFALLRRTCREDPVYPAGQVNSLYFDTPDLDQYERSDAGEYVKDKVRIRWYGNELDPHRTARPGCTVSSDSAANHDVQVWLELKSRRGFASTKRRFALLTPSDTLRFSALPHGVVPTTILVRTMADFGFFACGPLRPVVAVSYWRHRFIEPWTGFRISIDSHIRSSIVMPSIGHGERELELPGAIVEVKGPEFEVPRSLREIAEIGASWTRYSKYSSCLDGHAAARGSVSRLWPSGALAGRPGVLARVGETVSTTEPETALRGTRLVEDYEN